MWFRAAELKHGRVAMLASVGYLAGACGYTFPGEIAKGVSFASVNSDGVYNAWAKVPTEGKFQILLLILCLETANESKKPHYMRGGRAGPHRPAAVRPRRRHQRPVGAQDQVLGPAQLHRRAHGRAEGAQAQGRAEERPPRDDWHRVVPHRPQPARLGPGAQLGLLERLPDLLSHRDTSKRHRLLGSLAARWHRVGLCARSR